VATVESVDEVVSRSISDQQDRWHLRYYRDRISTYYEPRERPFALSLLDILSTAQEPLTFNDLFNRLKAQMATEDRESVLNIVSLLQRDHYIASTIEGKLSFRFLLIKRAWRIHRGLE
jgi:hypothetical protein